MIAVASRQLQNNRPKRYSSSSSSSYSYARQKTPEQLAREEEERLAHQKKVDMQTKYLIQCQEKAASNPREYPIKIRFNNNYFVTILQKNEELVFASSFNDAVKKVQEDIGSMDSDLMKQFKNSKYYKDGDVLRLSSANRSIFRNISLNTPDDKYNFIYTGKLVPCWDVIISSAKPTMLSSYRITSQNRYNTGGKSRKSTFKKGRAKKSRKSRSKKGRFLKG
jgi:hypothetical protein